MDSARRHDTVENDDDQQFDQMLVVGYECPSLRYKDTAFNEIKLLMGENVVKMLHPQSRTHSFIIPMLEVLNSDDDMEFIIVDKTI